MRESDYDVFICYSSFNKHWVETLARNLKSCGLSVFLDFWELVPGENWVPTLHRAIEQARAGILVATAEALDSGWVRHEYERLLDRRANDPNFRLIPVTVGEAANFPFVENIQWVDFAEDYHGAFQLLLCGLKGRRPSAAEATRQLDLEIPGPIRRQAVAPRQPQGRSFVDQVFARLRTNPVLMLLTQAGTDQGPIASQLLARAREDHGAEDTLHLRPPYSQAADSRDYFSALASQCGFSEQVTSAVHLEAAMEDRLRAGQSLFLLITRFEHGADQQRHELAGVLRALNEQYQRSFTVLLCGGEKLAEKKFLEGDLSLLNIAAYLYWPEPQVEDVCRLYRQWFEQDLDEEIAARVLDLSGGHAQLIAECLSCLEAGESLDGCREKLTSQDVAWQLFSRVTRDPEHRAGLRECLDGTDLGTARPFPAEPLLRRLYWDNLLKRSGTGAGERFVWRCDLVREVGKLIT